MRFPTPFRKDLKAKRKKYKPEAIPSTTIFRKGSVSSKDDLTLHAVGPSDLDATLSSARKQQEDVRQGVGVSSSSSSSSSSNTKWVWYRSRCGCVVVVVVVVATISGCGKEWVWLCSSSSSIGLESGCGCIGVDVVV